MVETLSSTLGVSYIHAGPPEPSWSLEFVDRDELQTSTQGTSSAGLCVNATWRQTVALSPKFGRRGATTRSSFSSIRTTLIVTSATWCVQCNQSASDLSWESTVKTEQIAPPNALFQFSFRRERASATEEEFSAENSFHPSTTCSRDLLQQARRSHSGSKDKEQRSP